MQKLALIRDRRTLLTALMDENGKRKPKPAKRFRRGSG